MKFFVFATTTPATDRSSGLQVGCPIPPARFSGSQPQVLLIPVRLLAVSPPPPRIYDPRSCFYPSPGQAR
jgi:hypothetical protein